MPTDKPLSDADDIIDLTDLVEEGSADGKAGNEPPVDMSFEQELEDLFGDAEPAPAKAAAPAPKADDADADDAIDLSGLEIDEPADTSVAAKPATDAGTDDDADAFDLAGLGLDEPEEPATPTATGKAPEAAADADAFDLAGLGLDEPGEPATPTAAGKAPGATADDDAMADLFGDDAVQAEGDDLLAGFDAATPQASETDEAEPAAADAPDTRSKDADDALDLSDMSLSAFEPEATPATADEKAPEAEPRMDDLLGDLPPAPTETTAKDAGQEPTPPDETRPVPAMAAATAAASVGAIDLAALDKLIDAAKGPAPEVPDAAEAADTGRLDALAARIDALETATATLCDKVESLPTAADGDALADALSARLEDALAERLEAVLAGQPQPTDHEALKAELLDAADEHGKTARDALLAEVRQSLTRLESLTQDQQGQFTDFAASMETRLTQITRDLPHPDALATKDSLAAGMEALGETLSRDIAGKLDERLTELRRELRETLSNELATTLDERLTEAMESAKQAARHEVEALGGVLSDRIEALESDRQDPEKFVAAIADDVTGQVREALAPSLEAIEAKPDRGEIDEAVNALREEMSAAIKKAVPKAAAAVIREEITALAKEFQ